jgi:hypothetical protein
MGTNMDHDTLQLIMGIIFLVLIVNTMAIWAIATTNNPQTSNPLTIDSSGTISSKTSPSATVSPDATKAATATPTLTPIKSPSASGSLTLTPVPTPKSYVEIVAPTPVAIETHQIIQPDLLIRSEEGYKTLYSLSNNNVSENMDDYIINVVNPPLIVDYDFAPYLSTDVKLHEYGKLSEKYSEEVKIRRPYEDSWFLINVTDKDTGINIIEDGAGRGRNLDLHNINHLMIPNRGKMVLDVKGGYGNITLTIKMRDPAKSTA